MIAEIINIFRIDKAFALASKGNNIGSLYLCNKSISLYFHNVNTLTPSVIESILLRSYLMTAQNDIIQAKKDVRLYFRLRRSLNYYNKDEKNCMDAYALGMYWVQKGKMQDSCIMAIRQNIFWDSTHVRHTVRARFGR